MMEGVSHHTNSGGNVEPTNLYKRRRTITDHLFNVVIQTISSWLSKDTYIFFLFHYILVVLFHSNFCIFPLIIHTHLQYFINMLLVCQDLTVVRSNRTGANEIPD